MKFWSKTPGYYMNRVGLVSSRRTHNFASMWEKKPNSQKTNNPTTQHNSDGKITKTEPSCQKGCINRDFGLKFYQLVSSQERGTIRSWSQPENPPGMPVKPSTNSVCKNTKCVFLQTEHGAMKGCRESHRCLMCWKLLWWERCPFLCPCSANSHLLHP